MAPRRPVSAKPERPVHSVDQKRQDIQRLRNRIKELEAFDPNAVTKRFSDPSVATLETSIDGTLAAVFGHNTVDYDRYRSAKDLDQGPVIMSMSSDGHGGGGVADDAREARQYVAEGKMQALSLLQQAIREIEEEIELSTPAISKATPHSEVANRKVFVVHGHDVAAREAMARFLDKIELEAIVLHEQPDKGLTIIEKFEAYASLVGFAVVLLTPDDLAGSASTPAQNARARQNVIFELGYFAGKLGRGRACLVRKGLIEIPSDLYGVIYTDMDEADGWKLKLARELKAAGLKFDADKVWA